MTWYSTTVKAHFGGPFLYCDEVCDGVCVVTGSKPNSYDLWVCDGVLFEVPAVKTVRFVSEIQLAPLRIERA
jgi:hypothetical protein